MDFQRDFYLKYNSQQHITTKLQRLMTISKEVTNKELLEEIKTLRATVESLSNQLGELQLKERKKKQDPSVKGSTELKPGDLVQVLSKAKYGRYGDKGTVLLIGKVFITIKLEGTGRTTTRLPQNLRKVK